LSLKVIEQAHNWRHFSNLASVAVPAGKRNTAFAKTVLEMFGIGLITIGSMLKWVDPGTVDVADVNEILVPKVNRCPGLTLRRCLREEHKTFAEAGNANKLRWSPFQQTCADVRKYVEQHPGVTLKQLVDSVKTHYHSPQTARICIAKYVEMGVLKGVCKELDGKSLRFYPDEQRAGVQNDR
jgi:hypothetical protein